MAATLGVETIQHTNGTTAVTVGTNGSVTAAGTVTADGLDITENTNARVYSSDGIGEVGLGNFAFQASNAAGNALKPFGFRGEDLRFATASEAMRIDNSGHVGINNTAPANYLDGELVVGNGTKDQYINVVTGTGNAAGLCFQDTTGTSIVGGLRYTHLDNALALWANGAERMRITSAGKMGFGTSTQILNGGGALASFTFGGAQGVFISTVSQSGGECMGFVHQGSSVVGTIAINNSSTSYNTSSDYRLKENVDYTWDATTRLKQLKPARFNFISDTDTTVEGFLAHEAHEVVPNSVTGTKDAMKEEVLYVEDDELPDGKNVGDVKQAAGPDYQHIDHSKLVPLLVKTIQELEARITALEA